jgi:membrane protein implicated in regulation of membrane protease activity
MMNGLFSTQKTVSVLRNNDDKDKNINKILQKKSAAHCPVPKGCAILLTNISSGGYPMSLIDFSPVLLWFLAGVVFFALELLLPGLIVFFFGLGAWCTALVLYLVPMTLASQLLVFLASSLLFLVLLRSFVKKIFLGRTLELDAMGEGVPIEGTGEVIEDILPPAVGKIKYGGSFWQARADQPLTRGTAVRILEKKNLTVKVAPLTKEGEA